jgi:hypothetical protein
MDLLILGYRLLVVLLTTILMTKYQRFHGPANTGIGAYPVHIPHIYRTLDYIKHVSVPQHLHTRSFTNRIQKYRET